jgi:hypothetical protein
MTGSLGYFSTPGPVDDKWLRNHWIAPYEELPRCRCVVLYRIYPAYLPDPFEEDSDVTGATPFRFLPTSMPFELTPNLRKPRTRHCDPMRFRRLFAKDKEFYRWETVQPDQYRDSGIPSGERFAREWAWICTRHRQRTDNLEK